MKHARGGYTMIEVFLVLAISGALLISAIALFGGKQAEAQFNQSMQDLESKMNSYINEVGVSVFPAAAQYTCAHHTSRDRPYLTLGGPVAGSNQDCIFLGKAINAEIGDDKISVYTVLGNRTYDPGVGARAPVTTFDNARPTPAVYNDDTLVPALIEEYSLRYGNAEIIYARVDATTDPSQNHDYEIAGFYNSLHASPDQEGSQSLLVKAYRLVSPVTIKQCIEETPPCHIDTPRSWTLCFEGNGGKDWATLAVNATPVGVNTQLTFKPDPTVCPG